MLLATEFFTIHLETDTTVGMCHIRIIYSKLYSKLISCSVRKRQIYT